MAKYVRKINLQRPNLSGAKDINKLIDSVEEHLSRMNKSIQDEFTNVERSSGVTQKDIINALTNSTSSSSSGSGSSVVITDYFRSGSVSVTSAGVPILFSSDMGIVPTTFQFRCYNALGETVGCSITLLTSTGFTATSMEDATLEYVASKGI